MDKLMNDLIKFTESMEDRIIHKEAADLPWDAVELEQVNSDIDKILTAFGVYSRYFNRLK